MNRFKNNLRKYVQEASFRSHTPYSGQLRAAVVVFSNGDWICGVKVENACYPLVIPAVTSALVIASSIGRKDVVAVIVSGKITESEREFIMQTVSPSLDQIDSDIIRQKGYTFDIEGSPLIASKKFPEHIDSTTGIRLAREAATYAYVPESDFPVGAIAVTDDHQYFQGANIECNDWTKIICAERVALASAMSAGATNIKHIFVSCPKSPNATPCGACRQVIHEIAPESTIWMDRGENLSEKFYIHDLLPHAFVLSH